MFKYTTINGSTADFLTEERFVKTSFSSSTHVYKIEDRIPFKDLHELQNKVSKDLRRKLYLQLKEEFEQE